MLATKRVFCVLRNRITFAAKLATSERNRSSQLQADPAKKHALQVTACLLPKTSGRRSEGLSIITRRYIVRTNSAAGSSVPGESREYSLLPVLAAVGVACAGAFAFGYHLGIVNGPLETICTELGVGADKALQGLVVSSTLAGAALGSLTGGGMADALGRRMSFILCSIPMLVGPLLSSYASGIELMIAGRFLAGVSIGLSSALVPTYISEVAPSSVRGALGSLNQLLICFGILGALLINVALPPTAWRSMFLVATLPAVLLGVGMIFSPDSPRWLAQVGRREAAVEAASKLWGPTGPSQLGAAPAAGTETKEAGWGDLLAPAYRRGALLGCVLFAFQQFSGINALIYFSSSVFRQAGVGSEALASAAVGAINVLGTLIATIVIDRAGRTDLLRLSYGGMAFTMLAMAAGFGLESLKSYAGPIALVGTLAYILAFAVGAGPVTGLIIPEFNAARIRGRAVAAAFVTHWVCNVVIGQTFIGAVDAVGISGVYTFFAAVSLMGVLFVNAFVPETKGKSLEQIEAEMSSK